MNSLDIAKKMIMLTTKGFCQHRQELFHLLHLVIQIQFFAWYGLRARQRSLAEVLILPLRADLWWSRGESPTPNRLNWSGCCRLELSIDQSEVLSRFRNAIVM
jgi:hypothetical protein